MHKEKGRMNASFANENLLRNKTSGIIYFQRIVSVSILIAILAEIIFTVTVYTCSLTGHDTTAVLKFYHILFFYESITTVFASL